MKIWSRNTLKSTQVFMGWCMQPPILSLRLAPNSGEVCTAGMPDTGNSGISYDAPQVVSTAPGGSVSAHGGRETTAAPQALHDSATSGGTGVAPPRQWVPPAEFAVYTPAERELALRQLLQVSTRASYP